MLTSKQIRQDFLDFFKQKEHTIVPSAPVVPHGDPTLLFTNAGMNQFKDIFLGTGRRNYVRAADTQKCIRVSGKHNDLEEVGKDGYHHTFFEMLGNWSFGDYYKKEAISWAWELLTDVWKLPKDRLFATVYEDDHEAVELWASCTDIGKERILRFGAKDNFWEMGETGPCGPCSEIHFDRTPDKSGRDLVNSGVPEVMEIWNLVFIQNERLHDGSLIKLPSCHIDTGMGFERIVSVLQQSDSNYDTDLFAPILTHIGNLAGQPYSKGEKGIPHQVIADHIRLLSFSLADGVWPANVGRGYVIRRILRRAARFGRKLGIREPFLYRLVDTVVEIYQEIFPELREQIEHIRRVIKAEETSFNRTLDRGIQLFEEATSGLKPGSTIPGEVIFRLYDTYGFPFDMTRQMGEENGFMVDEAAYEQEMQTAKTRSREKMKFAMSAAQAEMDWEQAACGESSTFTGYESLEEQAHIIKYRFLDEDQTKVQFLLDKTPFYGESGGQTGDRGTITSPTLSIRVDDTRKLKGEMIHIGTIEHGLIDDQAVTARVDTELRFATCRHHTATHLLHQALRSHLGVHVQQKGSMVSPERLRFDFSHYQGLTAAELKTIEDTVNSKILENIPLNIDYMGLEEAKDKGYLAFFGEKYEDRVRVIGIDDYSRELCGGTHCRATGDIGLCKIVSEGSISAGIRRIEAFCGNVALAYTASREELLNEVCTTLKCDQAEILHRAASLVEQVSNLQKEKGQLQALIHQTQAKAILGSLKKMGTIAVLTEVVASDSIDDLKGFADKIKDQLESYVIVLGCVLEDKAAFITLVSKDLVDRGVKAGQIIKPVAQIAGGGGGGAPHIAQAGGKQPEKVPQAITAAAKIVQELLTKLG